MSDKLLYCCYSTYLRDFLTTNKIRYEICALNPNTQNMFWVYVRDEKLNKLLSEWSSNR